MWRNLSLLIIISFCLSSFSSIANNLLPISPRASLTQTQQSQDLKAPEDIHHHIQLLAKQTETYQQALLGYEKEKLQINQKIIQEKEKVSTISGTNVPEQAISANLLMSRLKEQESVLSQDINELITRRNHLPKEIKQARERLNQHKKITSSRLSNNNTFAQLQRQLYQKQIETLDSELSSIPNRLNLAQLRLQLLQLKQHNQEQLIESLNQYMILARQKQTALTIAQSIQQPNNHSNPLSLELNKQNQNLAKQLVSLITQINQVVKQQEHAESLYQKQAKQIAEIQEQLSWGRLNSVFGEHFIQTLDSLPKPPVLSKLEQTIADVRLEHYQLEQRLNGNQQRLGQQKPSLTVIKNGISAQQSLLSQLVKDYEQYLQELDKLSVSYRQLAEQHTQLTNMLNEQLFWLPNASIINKQWLIDIGLSIRWLVEQDYIGQLSRNIEHQSQDWLWWLIVLTVCLAAQDLIRNRFRSLLRKNLGSVGNVTQDSFTYTLHTLLITVFYSMIKPTPIILAGYLLLSSSIALIHASGAALLAIGLFYLIHRIIYVISLPEGLLVAHFKRPAEMVARGYGYFKRFYYLNLGLIACIGFSQYIQLPLLKNSIGRGAFILLCLQLFCLVRHQHRLMEYYKQQSATTNTRLLQRTLWQLLKLSPLAAAVLAFTGYYFTAYEMLFQLLFSVFMALGVLLAYQLIKRWMLIERRRIAFDRAKAKRAEILAQRERGDTSQNPDSSEFYEEPVVDLETISSQSLGLVRSLLILGLCAGLIGLWTQTHSALFSFFDGITLWHSNVDGLSVPVTLKTLLYGIVVFGFSMMIAANLPGLLELTILQRLELTSGTGFAITTVSRYFVLLIGMLIGFNTLGVEWSKLQWLIAALSVGLGFGLQEIFANFISGLIILFEKPVRIGDTVTIRDLTGTVSKIQIRATTIIDWDRKEIIVPNKAFITEQLVNWSLSDPITRVTINVSTARDSDPAKVEAALYQAVQECKHTLSIPEPEVWFAGFGAHTQDYEIRAFATDMASRWPLRHELHKRITQSLKDNDLELSYPQLEIHLNSMKEPAGIIK
ncbi:mechanosensitive ion channel domain-containing protein [Parashewanella tropica]|uniref:mechanosensitive ion channel domain-containing protein n=1 Tax=Parashewanella tropica TaxID=2547970 RepID=UPI00105A9C33|nr:mechanosensitive ion channel domain-containing protein [Parashewanella tropica]